MSQLSYTVRQHLTHLADTARLPLCYLRWSICLLIYLSTLPGQAAVGSWSSGVGMSVKPINTLVADAQGGIYAIGLDGSFFKSDDGGANWSTRNLPAQSHVTCVTVAGDGSVYAGAKDIGVYKSRDHGLSWVPASQGLPVAFDVQALTTDSSGAVYAGSVGTGVYKSSDGGASWMAVNDGFTPGTSTILHLASDSSGNVYGAGFAGVYKTSDGGKRWMEVNNGLNARFISALTTGADGRVYAGNSGGGVFTSANGGELWATQNDDFPYMIGISTLLVAGDGSVYAATNHGIYLNRVGTRNWQLLGGAQTGTYDVRALAADSHGNLYAAGAGANGFVIFKSRDNGGAWTTADGGLSGEYINGLTQDAVGNLYTATFHGLYKSRDGGASWLPSGLRNTYPFCLARADDGTLYVGTFNGAVNTSRDDGATWSETYAGGGYISLLVSGGAGRVYAATERGIYASRDHGSSWAAANGGLPLDGGGLGSALRATALTVDAQGVLYAAIYHGSYVYNGDFLATRFNGGGVYKSRDSGVSWSEANGSLPSFARPLEDDNYNYKFIYALAVAADGSVYAGTPSGVYKSSDGGKVWQAANAGLGSSVIVTLFIAANGTLYAGSNDGKTFQSSDGGGLWRPLPDGLYPDTIRNITVSDDGTVYVATPDNGIHQYTPPLPSAAITARATANNSALQLTANVTVASVDVGQPGNLYLAVYLADGSLYQLTSLGWRAYQPPDLVPYLSTRLGKHTISLLDGSLDVSAFKGASFYAGYGSDTADMLKRGNYAQIYTIQ